MLDPSKQKIFLKWLEYLLGPYDMHDYAFFVGVPRHESKGLLLTSASEEWRKEFMAQKYIEVDPRATKAGNSPLPFLWASLYEEGLSPLQRESVDFCQAYNIIGGFTIAAHMKSHEFTALSFSFNVPIMDIQPHFQSFNDLFMLNIYLSSYYYALKEENTIQIYRIEEEMERWKKAKSNARFFPSTLLSQSKK